MTIRTRGLLALSAVFVLTMFAAQPASAQGTLTGDVPGSESAGGVALVQWSGGSVDDLQAAASQSGCSLRSVWLTVDGTFLGYVVGAPEFANEEWFTVVGAEVGPKPLLIVCATPGLDSCTASGSVIDYVAGAPGAETPREALDEGIQALSEFPDGAPPEGTFVEVPVSDATAESDATAVFELVAYDGAVIGRYTVVDFGLGWLLSGVHVCSYS